MALILALIAASWAADGSRQVTGGVEAMVTAVEGTRQDVGAPLALCSGGKAGERLVRQFSKTDAVTTGGDEACVGDVRERMAENGFPCGLHIEAIVDGFRISTYGACAERAADGEAQRLEDLLSDERRAAREARKAERFAVADEPPIAPAPAARPVVAPAQVEEVAEETGRPRWRISGAPAIPAWGPGWTAAGTWRHDSGWDLGLRFITADLTHRPGGGLAGAEDIRELSFWGGMAEIARESGGIFGGYAALGLGGGRADTRHRDCTRYFSGIFNGFDVECTVDDPEPGGVGMVSLDGGVRLIGEPLELSSGIRLVIVDLRPITALELVGVGVRI